MAKQTDWCPTTRQGQLDMVQNWIKIFNEPTNEPGKKGTKAETWGVPAAVVEELTALASAASAALNTAQAKETRTPVTNTLCKTAFDALVESMRSSKRRWLQIPPLTEADMVSLGFKPADTNPTRSGTPSAQVTIETFLVGRHQLGLRFIYVSGNPEESANKGFRYYYRVVAQGETPPVSPEELYKSDYTKRKKDIKDFDFGDSGKTVYMAVQIENEGRKGPWGPLVSALIP